MSKVQVTVRNTARRKVQRAGVVFPAATRSGPGERTVVIPRARLLELSAARVLELVGEPVKAGTPAKKKAEKNAPAKKTTPAADKGGDGGDQQ